MRIAAANPQAARLLDVRMTQRAATGPAEPAASRPAGRSPSAMMTAQLPASVAGPLADLLERDPGLAEAISAQLPAARDAARRLSGYDTPVPGPHLLDISG